MKKASRLGITAILIVTLLMSGVIAGCSNQVASPNTQGNGENTQQEGGFFAIKGSDSEVNVVQALVEGFADVNEKAEFSVTGGGSGTGIAALINKQTDIANSSRPMSDAEVQQAKANGVEPVPIVFAFDGLAVLVNAGNPVENLTVEQVGKIYAGEIKNWSEVGGEDKPISLYGRQSNSGTYVFFRDTVVKGDYSADMQMMPGTSQIVEGVRQDVTGIGYAAIGYVKGASGIKAVNIAEKAGQPYISPLDDEKVFSGIYPLTRPLFQYLNGKPSGALKQFIEFELSDEGQAIVVKQGFLPVTPEYVQKNLKYLK
ncbi:MAG: PstS family phosphate ABC transporter substrate-binding protein [Dethiobacter sp.]|nr:PstS family phosphate ABC transporter substrate-binding protein [Dethiobacter sp.]